MNHVGWRYFPNPWRRFCDRWWWHWFDLMAFWRDVKDACQRARQGWGNGDIFDLMNYHTGVTLGLLEHFKAHHNGYAGDSPEEYEAKLDLAIDAWKAKEALLNYEGWDSSTITYEEWRKPLEARWEQGLPAFLEIYDSLWN